MKNLKKNMSDRMSRAIINDAGLTAQQEHFAQLLSQHYNQSEAYRIAYPKSVHWKPEAVWSEASRLCNNPKVSARVKQLKDPVIEKFNQAREAMAQSIVDAATKAENDKGGPDHTTRHKAAKTGLDYLGYEAPQKVQSLNVNIDMSQEDLNKFLDNL